jgi:hypothetical protein
MILVTQQRCLGEVHLQEQTGKLAPTHQPSQRLSASIGRLRLKLSLRTISQGICLLGDSTCQISWRDQLSFTAAELPG